MRDATPQSHLAMFLAAMEPQSTKRRATLLAAAREAPVPWDAKLIKGIAFQVSPNDFEIYSVHPGFVLQERIEAVATARKVFYRAVDNLLWTREELAEAESKLHDKAEAAQLDHIEAGVQEKMFFAADAALALVDHSRRLDGALSVAGYDERVAVIRKDPEHHFIKGLRNSLQHSGVVRAISQTTTHWDAPNRTRNSYTVIINKHEILRAVTIAPQNWSQLARQYIEGRDRTIDIIDLFDSYRKRINDLHAWWQAEIEANAPPALTDFRRVKDMITRVRRIQTLKVLLPNMIAKDVDPYEHWHNYLTSGELEELETMPRHSVQQVDRLIGIADASLGLCDHQTRELVYRLFKVQA